MKRNYFVGRSIAVGCSVYISDSEWVFEGVGIDSVFLYEEWRDEVVGGATVDQGVYFSVVMVRM